MDWVRACKESPENRIETKSNFSFAGPLTEMVVIGLPAVRLQPLNEILEWDGGNMRFTNINDSETIRFVISDSFSIVDGHPRYNKKYTEPMNANQLAKELIKPNYREGWHLPKMPG